MGQANFLTPDQCKIQFPMIYKIFFENASSEPQEPQSTREPGESLHDYFTRKNMKCFCNKCRKTKRDQENDNNSTLL